MRALGVLIICALATGCVAANDVAQTKSTGRPDVYLITIDTLRADHVHCYGYNRIKTPALDALAKDGVRFANAFTPSPITNTSHTSILTGLLPTSHGVTDFGRPLPADHATVAELLKQNGYSTAAFIGSVVLDSRTLAPGLDRGFDYYDNFPEHSHTKSRWGRLERRAADVVRRAEAWRDSHAAGPHFEWIHLYDPHDPYEPPEPYSAEYKGRLYDGEIAYADSALQSFLAHLKQHGRYDNALIIVVGDHGEGLGEHDEETHGIFLYDSTLHVPMIFKLPGEQAAKLVQTQTRTIDIVPTILELLNIAAPKELEGASLKPVFNGTPDSDRTLLGETDYPLHFGWAPLRAVRSTGFKFIEAPRPELYNLHDDPGELNNKYEPWDTTVQKSRKTLADLRARTPAAEPSAATVGTGTLDELKALGYLGPADAGSATNVPEPSMLPDPKDKIDEQNLLHRAMLASEDGRTADARNDLQTVLKRNPNSETALTQLGILELHDAKYGEAADYLKRARDLRPKDATAALYSGEALQKSGALAGAREALETSLRLNPKQSSNARILLGRVYLGLKEPKAAEDQFEAALLTNPASTDAQLGIAQAEILDKRFADAVQQLQPLAKGTNANAEIYELLAQAYAGLGKTAEADRARLRAKALIKNTPRNARDAH
jgi:arylsulfatase A-like enzyme/Flp pilus assembly protein TadD